MTAKPKKSLLIANTFGAFGYLAICVQWSWLAVTQAIPLISKSDAKDLFIPQAQNLPAAPPAVALPDAVQIVLIVIALLFSIAVSIYAIFLVPKTIGKVGRTITNSGAEAAASRISKSKPHTKAARRLKFRLTWTIKFGLITLPVLALMLPVGSEIALSHLQVMVTGLALALASLLWFILQAILVIAYKFPPKSIW